MSKRVPASTTTRKRLEALMSGQDNGGSDLVKPAAQLIIEEALDSEVSTALGHDYYRHTEADGGGQRNGYGRGRVKSAEALSSTLHRRCVG